MEMQHDLDNLLDDDDSSTGSTTSSPDAEKDPTTDTAAAKKKSKRQNKAEMYLTQMNKDRYEDVKKPRHRYISKNLPIPVDSEGKEVVLSGASLFRAVVWHVVSFYAGPKLRCRKQKLLTRSEDMKNFKSVLELFFDSSKSWMNNEVKKVIISVLTDKELDLDAIEQVRKDTFLKNIFGKRVSKNPEAVKKRRDDRRMRLLTRVKGIFVGITRAPPPENIVNCYRQYVEEGNYFPDEFLFQAEISMLEFNDVGGVRRVTEKRDLVLVLFANFVFLRVLIPHIIQYPWECGLGRMPDSKSFAPQNLQCLASIVYRVVRKAMPDACLPVLDKSLMECLWSKEEAGDENANDEAQASAETAGVRRRVLLGAGDEDSDSSDSDDEYLSEEDKARRKRERRKERKEREERRKKEEEEEAEKNKKKKKGTKSEEEKEKEKEKKEKETATAASKQTPSLALNFRRRRALLPSANSNKPSRQFMELAEILNGLLAEDYFDVKGDEGANKEIDESVENLGRMLRVWLESVVDTIVPPSKKDAEERKEEEEEKENGEDTIEADLSEKDKTTEAKIEEPSQLEGEENDSLREAVNVGGKKIEDIDGGGVGDGNEKRKSEREVVGNDEEGGEKSGAVADVKSQSPPASPSQGVEDGPNELESPDIVGVAPKPSPGASPEPILTKLTLKNVASIASLASNASRKSGGSRRSSKNSAYLRAAMKANAGSDGASGGVATGGAAKLDVVEEKGQS